MCAAQCAISNETHVLMTSKDVANKQLHVSGRSSSNSFDKLTSFNAHLYFDN